MNTLQKSSKGVGVRVVNVVGIVLVLVLSIGLAIYAGNALGDHEANAAISFLWIAIILIIAKLSGLVERFGQPAVLGELVAGVFLGNLYLGGIGAFELIKHNEIIKFLAEFGVVILLFQIGLESNIAKMRKVGMRAFLVALVGVLAPFILGTYIVGPWLMPDLAQNTYLFLGAALTATSVGITARVFKDFGKLQMPEAQIVLGAAVLDDVMGLIILAIITAIVTIGSVSMGVITLIAAKAILFLVGSIVGGQLLAPYIGSFFSRIHSGFGMKLTVALAFGLIFAWIADRVGLAPIVGAFAAGLVLDPVHFRRFQDPAIIKEIKECLPEADASIKGKINCILEHHSDRHIETLLEPIANIFVPIFFVFTGMEVKLLTFFDPKIILVALGITVLAFVGKLLAGAFAGKVNKWIVGVGMIPRGEVGLIFASIGKSLGVVSDEVFSVIVVMVILTTLVTPMVLSALLKRTPQVAPAK